MKTQKALLIIDAQYDFMAGGSLEVPGAEKIIPIINDLMPKFDLIIFTKDWHPQDNDRFASNHKGKKPFDLIEIDG